MGQHVRLVQNRDSPMPFVLIAVLVLVANLFPLIFVIGTVLLCTVLFARHQHDLLIKERSIYTDREVSPRMNAFLVGHAYFETVIFGCIAGILPVVLMKGSYSGRTFPSTVIFVASIVIFYVILRVLRKTLEIRPLQWGLLRLSLPAGVVYSILDSIFVKSRPLGEVLRASSDWTDLWKDVFSGDFREILNRRVQRLEVGDLLEAFHSFIAFADEIIYRVLVEITGEFLGFILHIFLTLKLTYGVPICAFSVLLLMAGRHHKEPNRTRCD